MVPLSRWISLFALCAACVWALPAIPQTAAKPSAAQPKAARPRSASGPASGPATPPAKKQAAQVAGQVSIQARNATLYVTDHAIFHADTLTGVLISLRPDGLVNLDDRRSFTAKLLAGQVSISAEDLDSLVNRHLLPKMQAPIRNLHVSLTDGTMHVTGSFHKVVDVPFTATATLQPEGESLRIHLTDFVAAGVAHKSFLEFFGLRLSTLVKPPPGAGVVEGDDILLQLGQVFPPPPVTGTVTTLRIADNRLWITFGSGPAPAPLAPSVAASSYFWFHGGRMHFGRITMEDVDMELLGTNGASSLVELSLSHYQLQMQAGYAKSTASMALVAYVPTYTSLAGKNGLPK